MLDDLAETDTDAYREIQEAAADHMVTPHGIEHIVKKTPQQNCVTYIIEDLKRRSVNISNQACLDCLSTHITQKS